MPSACLSLLRGKQITMCQKGCIVCVCVYTRACLLYRLGTEYGMDGLCSLPLQICFFWIVFCFFCSGLENCPVHRHSCILCYWSPLILYQSHPTNMMRPWHWADDFTLKQFRATNAQGFLLLCRQPDVGWLQALQTSEDISNLKFYTLPFNHCLIHLLVIPTLYEFSDISCLCLGIKAVNTADTTVSGITIDEVASSSS